MGVQINMGSYDDACFGARMEKMEVKNGMVPENGQGAEGCRQTGLGATLGK